MLRRAIGARRENPSPRSLAFPVIDHGQSAAIPQKL
jgi:hypothetical protein